MASPTKFYYVTKIILLMWSCDQSLVTVDFYETLPPPPSPILNGVKTKNFGNIGCGCVICS